MKNISLFFLLITVACNSLNKDNVQSNNVSGKTQYDKRSIFDTAIVKSSISKLILNYMEDTSIIKYNGKIMLLTAEFFYEKEDTIFSISGHSVMPVIGPQNKLDGYDFKGYLFFKNTPVLFYDNIKGFGFKYYDINKLIKDSLKLDEDLENRIGFPRWIFKVNNSTNFELIKKRDAIKFK